MGTIFKYTLKDISGVYPQKAGRKPNRMKEKYKGMQVSTMAIGHIDPKTKRIIYNEMVEHPVIKRILKEVGNYDASKTQPMDGQRIHL